MKKMLLTFALAALAGSALQAQNLIGSWQGAIKPGPKDLRIVIKIAMADDKLKAAMYTVDQPSQPLPASTFTHDGSSLKMSMGPFTFDGKVSSDGNSITGTWTVGGPANPLSLTRATPETAWAIPDPPPPPVKMAANANPEFEVATIKPSEPNKPGKLFTIRGANVVTINTTLNDIITMAYNLHTKQLVGGPAWLDTDKWDVTGKPDVPGQPNVDQLKILLQKLVVDRFQLKFHKEKRELSVYAVTITKTGKKFEKSERPPDSLPGLFFRGLGDLVVSNATIAEFANLMQGAVLDRPVVDQTGLTEKYDFNLKWTPEPGQFATFGGVQPTTAEPAVDAPPDLFSAIQKQLGLKLEPTKAPVEVFVLDRVEKPSAN